MYEKVCATCQEPFTPTRKSQMYCSRRCSPQTQGFMETYAGKGMEPLPVSQRWYFSEKEGCYKGFATIRGERRYGARARLLMDAHMGRKLASWEQVYHKNRDRRDDRIENLEIRDRRK